jgi:hypothetical protein
MVTLSSDESAAMIITGGVKRDKLKPDQEELE